MGGGNTYEELIAFGHTLLETANVEEALPLVSEYVRKITGAMRCSIFLYDKEKDILWTILATGIEKIHISSDQGIVGYVFQNQEAVIENDVENNPHFLKSIDEQSGYKTVNMLACPIYNGRNELLGVLQLINKPEAFREEDLQFLKLFINFISSFVELEPFYSRGNQ